MTRSVNILRLATRGSLLARMQSQLVADELQRRHPGLRVELTVYKTTGDRITDRPLHESGGKGLFTKELEQALLDGAADFAVHSFKDVPVTMPLVDQSNLTIAAVPARQDPRDVLVSGKARQIADLPTGSRVGTGSLRRRCQLLALRPDLRVELIRGNIDTRLGKQRGGEYDAVVLALAGLVRSNLFDPAGMFPIDSGQMLPSPGQGALALQCRADDAATRQLLAVMNDPVAAACVQAERDIVRALEGDCHSPIAALAVVNGGRLTLQAAVGARDGTPPVLRAAAESRVDDAPSAVESVLACLRADNVQGLLGGNFGAGGKDI